jgi:hypothetical protein
VLLNGQGKAYRKAYSEKDIQDAIEYLHAGHTKDIKCVTNKFGIKYGIFHNHYLGLNTAANQSQEPWQHLTDAEDIALCDWIKYSSETGQPLNFYRKLKRLSRQSHHKNGIGNFSKDILTFDWASHLVLTQSKLNVSIGVPLMNTFRSLARLWMRRRSLGVMSTIWTKRDVLSPSIENCVCCQSFNLALRTIMMRCDIDSKGDPKFYGRLCKGTSIHFLTSPLLYYSPPVHMYSPSSPLYHFQGPYLKPTTSRPDCPTTFQKSTHR